MASPISPVGVPAQLSLSEINNLIAQQESLLGPLVTLGNDTAATLLFFDHTQEPPERHAMISRGALPAGAIPIATGKIFVAGELADVTAFRIV
jgi:hypothetical protein